MQANPYYFDSSLIEDKEWKDNKQYKSLELDATKHASEYNRIADLLHKSAPNFVVEKITLIWNPGLTRMFEGQIEILSNRFNKPAFQPSWDKENNPQLRKKVIEKLTKQTTVESGVHLLPVWHGTNPNVMHDICSDGFAALQKTDTGFFGKGLYFSTSAEYCGKVYAPEVEGKKSLILCWTCIGNVYPVIDGDMDKLLGKANYKNYDTHYVPVRPKNPFNPKETVFYPCAEEHNPVYDEVVLFSAVQAIPRAIVQGKLISNEVIQEKEEIRAREVVDSPVEITKEFQSSNNINILVWGTGQSGKSSFINGAINLFRPKKPLKQFAKVMSSGQAVTDCYTRYDVANLLSEEDEQTIKRALKLTLWDNWGWGGKAWMKKVVGAVPMIEGRVRPGTHMKDTAAIMEHADPNLRCHAVIMVVNPGMRLADDDLRDYVKEVSNLGITPVLVITMESEFDSEERKILCVNEFIQITGLPRDRVFFFNNYNEEEPERTVEKDAIYARIMMKAFSDAFKMSRA